MDDDAREQAEAGAEAEEAQGRRVIGEEEDGEVEGARWEEDGLDDGWGLTAEGRGTDSEDGRGVGGGEEEPGEAQHMNEDVGNEEPGDLLAAAPLPAATVAAAPLPAATVAAAPLPPPPAAAAQPAAIWEVMLSGRFVAFSAAEQSALEEAHSRGEATAAVRGGSRLVTLRPPYVQRAAPGEPRCRERDVRRRLSLGRLEKSDRQRGESAVDTQKSGAPPPPSPDLEAGAAVRVRWTAWEPWRYATVTGKRVFDGGALIQHGLVMDGTEEWVDLAEAYAYESL